MLPPTDMFLGTFLILCGFGLSLFNLRRIIKDSNSKFSSVLLSENLLLMCVGIAFVSKSIHDLNPINIPMDKMEERSSELLNMLNREQTMDCRFLSVLMSYGPFIISSVNSFLSLIIDNYMHYRMVDDVRKVDEENTVQEIGVTYRVLNHKSKSLFTLLKKYFSYIAIVLQWVVPVLIAASMYSMNVNQKMLDMGNLRTLSQSCIAMVDVSNETCSFTNIEANETLELRKYIPSDNYFEIVENKPYNSNDSGQVDAVINNIYSIITKLKDEGNFDNFNVTSPSLQRKSKSQQKCMKVCYIDNKNLLLYMFLLCIVSYFIPITISVTILTKIHGMDIKKPNVKTYVSRELLYNILFWTPVMFDTFLSLILCSYSMNGIRTSVFGVAANVYQAVKNIMNAKYFKDNSVLPI